MIRFYFKGQHSIIKESVQLLDSGIEDLIWIDLHDPSIEDIEIIELKFGINIPSRLQQEEIESSSRYFENEDNLVINSTFIKIDDDYTFHSVHVSFILKDNLLISYRDMDLISFAETVKKIKANPKSFQNGLSILLAIFETRVDMDADLIEKISGEISKINRQLTDQNISQKELLLRVVRFQEIGMKLRENIIDKQRVTSYFLKSEELANGYKERFRILLEDINSLEDHSDFMFERLEYLQNTFLGLVNIEQNKIIKIFTIISVVFMPPTLIASIYGMNFKNMPELTWDAGYPFAFALMVLSALGTLYLFKKRKWI
jgi:magnesium transporter